MTPSSAFHYDAYIEPPLLNVRAMQFGGISTVVTGLQV